MSTLPPNDAMDLIVATDEPHVSATALTYAMPTVGCTWVRSRLSSSSSPKREEARGRRTRSEKVNNAKAAPRSVDQLCAYCLTERSCTTIQSESVLVNSDDKLWIFNDFANKKYIIRLLPTTSMSACVSLIWTILCPLRANGSKRQDMLLKYVIMYDSYIVEKFNIRLNILFGYFRCQKTINNQSLRKTRQIAHSWTCIEIYF